MVWLAVFVLSVVLGCAVAGGVAIAFTVRPGTPPAVAQLLRAAVLGLSFFAVYFDKVSGSVVPWWALAVWFLALQLGSAAHLWLRTARWKTPLLWLLGAVGLFVWQSRGETAFKTWRQERELARYEAEHEAWLSSEDHQREVRDDWARCAADVSDCLSPGIKYRDGRDYVAARRFLERACSSGDVSGCTYLDDVGSR